MYIVNDDIPLGCVYEGENGKTKYCPMLNHDDVPYCQYLEDDEAAIGIDERPVYCPIVEFPSADVQPEITEEDAREWCYKRGLTIIDNALYLEMRSGWSASADTQSTRKTAEQPEPSKIARDIATIIENEIDMRVIAQPEWKKGRWIDTESSYADGVRQECRCSVCSRLSPRPLGDFCRWCGADMRSDEDG